MPLKNAKGCDPFYPLDGKLASLKCLYFIMFYTYTGLTQQLVSAREVLAENTPVFICVP